MESLDKQGKYFAFLHEHKDEICKELLTAYDESYKEFRSSVLHDCDFPISIGVPLFIIWIFWVSQFHSTKEQLIPAALIIALGVCVRLFTKHVIAVSRRRFFEKEERKEILLDYTERCRVEDLAKVETDSEYTETNEFYDYCSKKNVFKHFHYYEKRLFHKSKNKRQM